MYMLRPPVDLLPDFLQTSSLCHLLISSVFVSVETYHDESRKEFVRSTHCNNIEITILTKRFCCTVFRPVDCGVCVRMVSGSDVHVCPRFLLEFLSMAKLATHRHKSPRSVRNPCSHAHFGRFSTACVSSPRDWAVFIMVKSVAPPQQSELFPAQPWITKMAINAPLTQLFSMSTFQRVFHAPLGDLWKNLSRYKTSISLI